MTKRTKSSVEITTATLEQWPALSNLYQLYIHDFTDFVEQLLREDGRFDYDPLPPYWTEPDQYPFMVWVDGSLAGFVLVKKGSDFSGNSEVWDMADFFIVLSARRKGIGCDVAEWVWRQFPGPWEVCVMPTNVPALKFWAMAVSRALGTSIVPELVTRGDDARYLFLFESKVNLLDDPQ